jgi:kynurenine formamidase
VELLNIIDLSQNIDKKMSVYPGTKKPIIDQIHNIEKEGYRESEFIISSHTGTHIDAPAHMLNDGAYLDQLSLEHFFGKATILDFSMFSNRLIAKKDLALFKDKIDNTDFLLIKTNWSKYFGQEMYFKGFPTLTEEAAKWLSQFKLKGIGIDAISIDTMDTVDFEVHRALLGKDIIIIENLTNLDAVIDENFILSIMPIKYENADGSPVRAVALEKIE